MGRWAKRLLDISAWRQLLGMQPAKPPCAAQNVPPCLATREWRWKRGGKTAERGPGCFRIMSYNILGDQLASKHTFLYTGGHHMRWTVRLSLILQEIDGHAPDVLCLQEVDHYDQLETALRSRGFMSHYAKRTGEYSDGCATFWRTSKFDLCCMRSISFSKLRLRENVALVVGLNFQDDPSFPTLWVANTHLLFNPKRGDIKMAQLHKILNLLDGLSSHGDAQKNGIAILAGDLNTSPHSPIYNFLRRSWLECLAHNRARLSGQLKSKKKHRGCGGASEDSTSAGRHKKPKLFANEVATGQSLNGASAISLATTAETGERNVHNDRLMMDNQWTLQSLQLASGKDDAINGDSEDERSLQSSSGSSATESDIDSNSWTALSPLKLQSAYFDVLGNEPSFTSWHKKGRETVDYIWYGTRRHSGDGNKMYHMPIEPVGVLQQPLARMCSNRLPARGWPSDHILICVDFVQSSAK
ncbi:unnamed protein product [Ostreobium quekettii]|uniref:Endonuclease/exonuclease/phosphatase domain-containing protein n=1 Tax=Ostreobium quekettii TaxID=121088 RepID=A0A8S1IXR5_9CHLO|nr:unnamed protein product [Ostreobium quekettii]